MKNNCNLLLLFAFYMLIQTGSQSQTLTTINPEYSKRGVSNLKVSISGQNTNFTQGSNTVWFSQGSSTIYANNVTTVNNTLIESYIYIPTYTNTGFWNVNVNNYYNGLLTKTDGFYVYGQTTIAETLPPANIKMKTATLNGHLFPNNLNTTVTFDYGLTNSYGNMVLASQSPVSGSVPVFVSADIISLTESTTYHFRTKTVNSDGTRYGSDMTFRTSSCVNLFTSAAPSQICPGGSSQLKVLAGSSAGFNDNFDPMVPSQWISTGDATTSVNCGSVSGNALYFNGYNRQAITNDLNVSSGGIISFYLKIAFTSSGSCEQADSGEEVFLHYSTNGGNSWTEIRKFLTDGTYQNFTQLTISVPVSAYSTTTRFKWSQPNNSGSGLDNWSIDDISITIAGTGSGNYSYNWSPSAGLSSTTIANPIATVNTNTTYTVAVTDNDQGCSSTSTISLTVSPLVIDAGPDILLACSDTARLDIRYSPLFSEDFDPVNSSQWQNLGDAVYSDICGSVSGKALFFSGNIRTAITKDLDLSSGGTISFYLKIPYLSSYPCDAPYYGYDVNLQYSTNGGSSWMPLETFYSGSSKYSDFTYLTIPILSGTLPSSTRFRWNQSYYSQKDFDVWAIDRILITRQVIKDTAYSYKWNPTVGLSSSTIPNPIVTTNTPVTYTITVKSLIGNCSATDTVHVGVTKADYSLDFSANPQLITAPPFAVQFINSTSGLNDYNFTWDFGNGIVKNSNNAVVFYQYQYNGLYTVKLIAANKINGCTDTLIKRDYIFCTSAVAYPPVADFVGTPAIIPKGDTVNFSDLSTNNPTAWKWLFPGGTPDYSNQQNPKNIIYNSDGIFNVTLTASNLAGPSITTKINYITAGNVGFEESDFSRGFDVFPNPNRGVIHLIFKNSVPEFNNIKIFNLNGEIIYFENKISSCKNASLAINISKYPNGIYFLVIESSKRTFFSKLIKE